MIDLARITNAPRPVALAGAVYLVPALTLAQWGRLQAFLLARVVRPAPIGPEVLASLGAGGEAVEAARLAADLAANWPPRVPSRAWFLLLEVTDGGRDELLREAGCAGAIGKPIPPAEWARFLRACLFGDPDHVPEDEPGRKPAGPAADDWAGTFHWLSGRKGWTYRQIAGLTLPQLRAEVEQAEAEDRRAAGKRKMPTAAEARAAINLVKADRRPPGTNGLTLRGTEG